MFVKGHTMYAVVRHGKLKPGLTAEFTAKAEQAATAMTGKIAGFKNFYVIAGEGDALLTIGVFENKAAADAAQAAMGDVMQSAFAPMLAAPPLTFGGNLVVSKTF